ncbi:RHS repeat-associated core domain-containing protein [Mucilaginibacter sp. UC70_90]
MPGSPVATPTTPNKQLYNGGSEWQNDYGSAPDYYQTLNRNYDAALGRFIAVDPMAEATGSMSVYEYANNNPVMMNDPDGNYAQSLYYSFMSNPGGSRSKSFL